MTAATDHITLARIALADADVVHGGPAVRDEFLARAQVHATLALAEEARTANLLRSIDYGFNQRRTEPDERRAEITARLWPTS